MVATVCDSLINVLFEYQPKMSCIKRNLLNRNYEFTYDCLFQTQIQMFKQISLQIYRRPENRGTAFYLQF